MAKSPKKPAKDAGPKLVRTEVPLARIDPTYAQSVRASQSEDHVARLVDAYEGPDAKKVPAVEVFTWEGADTYFLAEGAHRCAAKGELGAKKVAAEVWVCSDKRDARRRALERAAAANEHPGLTRSAEDKRAAVRAVLLSADHAGLSDRQVGDICKVGHVLVRLVREGLSHEGNIHPDHPAHASKQKYKAAARLRGELVSDGKGNLVKPAPASPPPPPAPPPSPPEEPEPDQPEPEYGEPVAGSTPAAQVVARPAALGWRSRPVASLDVPEDLLSEWLFTNVTTLGDVADALDRGEKWNLDADMLAGLRDMLAGAVADSEPDPPAAPAAAEPPPRPTPPPTRVCPHVGPDGRHEQGGRCRVCRGEGRITDEQYAGLSAELKELCDLRDSPPKQDERVRDEFAAASADRARRALGTLAHQIRDVLKSPMGPHLIESAARHGARLTRVLGVPYQVIGGAVTVDAEMQWEPVNLIRRVLDEADASFTRGLIEGAA